MAITPNEQPNQFMFTALPFEGMINYEMQQKRQRDAMNMQMNAQLGKFEGEMNAKKHWINDDDDFDNIMSDVRNKTDEFLAQHPEGLSGNDAQRGFHRLMAETSNDPRLRAMAYNHQSILQAKKDLKKDTDMDDMAKANELSKLQNFKTMGDNGEISYYTQGGVKGYDRNKSILDIAEKVPAIKTFREQSVEDKIKFIKEEKLAFNDIIRKAKPYIDADPDIMRVKKYRVENGLQTAEDFDKEIAYHLAGAANLLEHSDEFKPTGGVKAAKSPVEGAYTEGLGNVAMQVNRDLSELNTGMTNDQFAETGYNYTSAIDMQQQQLDKLNYNPASDIASAQATIKKNKEDILALEKTNAYGIQSHNIALKQAQNDGLAADIKTLSTPKTAVELAEEESERVSLKANIYALKTRKILTDDAIAAGMKGVTAIDDAKALFKNYTTDGKPLDIKKLDKAITKAAIAAEGEKGSTPKYGEKVSTGFAGQTNYSNANAKFAEVIADEMGITGDDKTAFIKEVSLVGSDASDIMSNAVDAANDVRIEQSQKVLDRRNVFTEGEKYIIAADAKAAREAFGATAIENSFFNQAYADTADMKPFSGGPSYTDIKNFDAVKTVKFLGQTVGNVGGSDRRNVIEVTWKGSNGLQSQKFHTKIPDEFKKQSDLMYSEYVTKGLSERGLLTADPEVNETIKATAMQLELEGVPNADNYYIVDNGDGTESEFKVRFKDGVYTPFMKDGDTYRGISYIDKDTKKAGQFASTNLKDVNAQIASAAGSKASMSPIIKDADKTTTGILGLVNKHEAGKGMHSPANKGYNTIVNQNWTAINKELGKPVSKATVKELDAAAAAAGKGNSAMGSYQITRETRDDFFGKPGKAFNVKPGGGAYTKDDIFNKGMQDAMYKYLINSKGKGDYPQYQKDGDKDAFIYRLSKVWASMPKDKSGKSYYADDKFNNKALVSYDEMLNLIETIG